MWKTLILCFSIRKLLLDCQKYLPKTLIQLSQWSHQSPIIYCLTTNWWHLGIQVTYSEQVHQGIQWWHNHKLPDFCRSLDKMVHWKTRKSCSYPKCTVRSQLVDLWQFSPKTVEWRCLTSKNRILPKTSMALELVTKFIKMILYTFMPPTHILSYKNFYL